MTNVAAIVGVITGFVGLLAYVVRVSMKYQSVVSRLEQNEKRDEEERKENSMKFNELYNSRNKTNETLVELTTTVKMMVSNMDQQFNELNKKIDELKGSK